MSISERSIDKQKDVGKFYENILKKKKKNKKIPLFFTIQLSGGHIRIYIIDKFTKILKPEISISWWFQIWVDGDLAIRLKNLWIKLKKYPSPYTNS